MKRLFILMLALLVLAPAVAADKRNKQLEKARKTEYKTTMKRYKKQGWQVFGSPRSLEVLLLTYYEKMDALGDDGYGIMGAAKAHSKNLLHRAAQNNAAQNYAMQAGNTLKGRMVSDGYNDADNLDAEFDRFYAAYETLVEAEIKGEMREQFSVYRSTPDGGYEIESYFIVDEDAASRARIRAYEKAAKESAAAQKYATVVADFVRKGFTPSAPTTAPTTDN